MSSAQRMTPGARRQQGGEAAAQRAAGERSRPGGGEAAAQRAAGERSRPGGREAAAPRAAGERNRSRSLVALDCASLALCALLAALALARIETLPPLSWAPGLALAALAGWALADLASGAVHFACDRFGREDIPLLGPAVIRPFREHHRDPEAIARHGFVELSGNSALALSPLLAAAGELAPLFGEAFLPSAVLSGLLSACTGMFTTNQIHRWAHGAEAPWLARALRRLGLAITPPAHARHHCGAHDRAFCITTGWWNEWLDRREVPLRAERWLRAVLAPRRDEEPPEAGAAAEGA